MSKTTPWFSSVTVLAVVGLAVGLRAGGLPAAGQ